MRQISTSPAAPIAFGQLTALSKPMPRIEMKEKTTNSIEAATAARAMPRRSWMARLTIVLLSPVLGTNSQAIT